MYIYIYIYIYICVCVCVCVYIALLTAKQTSLPWEWRGGGPVLASTRDYHYQYCILYGIQTGGRGGVVYWSMDVQE